MDGPALQHIGEADLHGRSAELVVDGQSLLIAHVHVHSVEPIADVRIEPGHGLALGTLPLGEDEWPVYCLDGDLDILDRLPGTRRACVLVKTEFGGIGILCDEVRVVDNGAFATVPVPGCMQGEQSLMQSLAIIDARVTCVLDADRLSATLLAEMTNGGVQATPLAAGEQ
jgi:hypothetical protein